jgi:hypothetical protein
MEIVFSNLNIDEMERKYRIYLHEIAYDGENIGKDLTFTIQVDKGTAITITPDKIGKALKHGKTEKDFRALLHTGSTKEKSIELEGLVKVLEVDKISDPGEKTQKIKVDMEKPFGQSVSITVEVKAKGGDAPKVGKFTLKLGIEPAFVMDANSKGVATAGPYDDAGTPATSTEKQVKAQGKHIADYDGPAEFYVEYQIVLNAKGALDTANSTARFISITWTNRGTTSTQGFNTFDLPITAVVFGADKSVVDSFKVEGEKWYRNLPRPLKDKHLKATVDLKNKKAAIEAAYYSERDGVISTYTITGTVTDTPKAMPVPPVPVATPLYLL